MAVAVEHFFKLNFEDGKFFVEHCQVFFSTVKVDLNGIRVFLYFTLL